MHNSEKIIWQNRSGRPEFSETSFISILHEKEIWDTDLYWEYDKALQEISEIYRDKPMPKELILALYDFLEYTFGRLCYHQMPSDGSTIENLSDELCILWRERITHTVRAALGGYSFSNEGFQLTNPLM